MPKTCVRKCPGGVTMHRFPSRNDMPRRVQWMKLLGVTNSSQNKELYACERHFSPRYRNIRHLSKGAIPDKNLAIPMVPSPPHHQQPKNVFLRRNVSDDSVDSEHNVISEHSVFLRRNVSDDSVVSEHNVISEHSAVSEQKFEEEHLCRLCGELQENVISLFGEDREDLVTLVTATLRYLNIEFTDKDVFPKWLCATCHVHAELANKFLVMVREAQIKLGEVVQAERQTCQYLITELQESDTAHTKTEEDCASHFSTMVRNKLENGTNVYSLNDSQSGSTLQQKELFASNNDTNLYKCRHCGATYKDKHLFTAHLAKHSSKLYFKCNKCNERFTHNDEITMHMRTHARDQSLVNEHCPETSACPSSSNQHELKDSSPNVLTSDSSLSHTGENGYSFTVLKAHQNLNPFKCAVCGKPFEFKYLLNQHLRVHDNEKPHQCPLCPQTFFLKAQLKSHLSQNHGSYKEAEIPK